MSGSQRILIVRLGAMGDIIHAFPAAMALRGAFPSAEIGWVVERRWADLVQLLTGGEGRVAIVNKIHLVDTRVWRKAPFSTETRRDAVGVFREIRSCHYDMAVDLQGSMKSAVVAVLSGARQRFGFADPREKPAGLLYTSTLRTSARHVVDQNLELAKAVGHETGQVPVSWELRRDSEVEERVQQKLATLGLTSSFAILNPGAGWGAKQWPAERYAKLARALGADGIRSLVNFGPGEQELAGIVTQEAGNCAVAAQFTIAELIAVTRRASLFVGGDTGPMHLAALFGVPVVAIFGPTDPTRNGPYTERKIVLRDSASQTSHVRKRETEAGLLKITSEEVIAAARKLLNTKVSA